MESYSLMYKTQAAIQIIPLIKTEPTLGKILNHLGIILSKTDSRTHQISSGSKKMLRLDAKLYLRISYVTVQRV